MSFVHLDCDNLLQRVSFCYFLWSGEMGLGEEARSGGGFITPNTCCAAVPVCAYAWDLGHVAQGLLVARLAAVSSIF